MHSRSPLKAHLRPDLAGPRGLPDLLLSTHSLDPLSLVPLLAPPLTRTHRARERSSLRPIPSFPSPRSRARARSPRPSPRSRAPPSPEKITRTEPHRPPLRPTSPSPPRPRPELCAHGCAMAAYLRCRRALRSLCLATAPSPPRLLAPALPPSPAAGARLRPDSGRIRALLVAPRRRATLRATSPGLLCCPSPRQVPCRQGRELLCLPRRSFTL